MKVSLLSDGGDDRALIPAFQVSGSLNTGGSIRGLNGCRKRGYLGSGINPIWAFVVRLYLAFTDL
jgi:hypothetical protein